jgi:hypothetical protein
MSDEFEKTTIKKFGARGSPVYEQEQKTTDLGDLTERTEETAVPFCECGEPIMTTAGDVSRCCACELLCCKRCRIRHRRRTLCPRCARDQYVDKPAYLALVFLQHELMTPDELIEVTTHDGEIIEVDIDAVATALLEGDYLTEAGDLSSHGTEALHIGHQLYGDDADIQAVRTQIRLQEVIDQ